MVGWELQTSHLLPLLQHYKVENTAIHNLLLCNRRKQLRSARFFINSSLASKTTTKKTGTNWSINQLDDGELVIEVSRSHATSGGISHNGKWLVDVCLHRIYSWKQCCQIADAIAWSRVPVRPVPFSSMLLSIFRTALVASYFAEHC